MKLIHYYYRKIELYLEEFDTFKSETKKMRTLGYMNIYTYHNETSLDFGLIRIHGNCPTGKMLSLLQSRFKTFELKLEVDLVAIMQFTFL